jgi:hypothetical protein
VAEVEAWYQKQMVGLGWQLDRRQGIPAKPPQGAGLRLEYTNDRMRAVVALVYSPQAQLTQVSLMLRGK